MLRDIFIRGPYYFAHVYKLLKSVGAPARDPRDRKQRSEKLGRQIKHVVYKAAVEVHISADALIDPAFFRYDLGRETLDKGIKPVLIGSVFFLGKPFYKSAENLGSRIRNRVNRMSHAVYQTAFVVNFAVEHF